jgi:hypothetical protein
MSNAILEQVGGETVTQAAAAGGFRDLCGAEGVPYRFLNPYVEGGVVGAGGLVDIARVAGKTHG